MDSIIPDVGVRNINQILSIVATQSFVSGLFYIAIYLLPSFIAYSRGHHNAAAISVLNLLLGWTIIGWAIAMVWAFTAVRVGSASQSRSQTTDQDTD